jgi:hypothetical protein
MDELPDSSKLVFCHKPFRTSDYHRGQVFEADNIRAFLLLDEQ